MVEELAVAAKYNVPVIVVIINNAYLSLIRQNQKYAYRASAIALVTCFVIGVLFYKMPLVAIAQASFEGFMLAIFPILWVIVSASICLQYYIRNRKYGEN